MLAAFWRQAQACFSPLLSAIAALTSSTSGFTATPDQLSALVGAAGWFCQLDRLLYSVFDAVYVFGHSEDASERRIPYSCCQELWLFAVLSLSLRVDLLMPWYESVVATDAAPEFGFGACRAPMTAQVRQLLLDAEGDQGRFVQLPSEEGDEPGAPRTGRPVHLPLRKTAFATVFSIPAREKGHSGQFEATAVLLAIRRLLRSPEQQHRHIMLLVDAKAVVGALRKGRSSAPTLKHVIKAIAGLCLAGSIRLHILYVHTKSNPADAPSRGICSRPKPAAQHAKDKYVRKHMTKKGLERQRRRILDRWDRYQEHVKAAGGEAPQR